MDDDYQVATMIANKILHYQKLNKITNQCMSNCLLFVNLCKDFNVNVGATLDAGVIYNTNKGTATVHMWCMSLGNILELSYEFSKIPNNQKIYTHGPRKSTIISEEHQATLNKFKILAEKFNNNRRRLLVECNYYDKLEKYVLENIPHIRLT